MHGDAESVGRRPALGTRGGAPMPPGQESFLEEAGRHHQIQPWDPCSKRPSRLVPDEFLFGTH